MTRELGAGVVQRAAERVREPRVEARPLLAGAARPRTDFPMLADLYLTGRLKIDELITSRYALDDVGRAIHDLESGALARGVFQL